MIERIIITNTFAQQIVADLVPKFSATAPRYTIENLTGHGPVGSELATSPNPGSDGDTYHRARVGARNLVITLGYNRLTSSMPSISERRHDVYETIPPKTKVRIDIIRTGLSTLTAEGYVETVEPDLFSAEPQLVISILCPDPYFSVGGLMKKTISNKSQLANLELGSGETGFRIWMVGIPITTNYVEFSNTAGESIRATPLTVASGGANALDLSTFAGDRYMKFRGGSAFDKLVGSLQMTISMSKPLAFKTSHTAFLPFEISYYYKEVGV